MNHQSLRFVLRSGTAGAHTSLEAAVGSVGSLEAYCRYLRGLFEFRAPIENTLRSAQWPALFGTWRPSTLCHLLAADMTDLGQSPWMYDDQAPPLQNTADFLGVAYVLEGATLGARVLYRTVAELGLHGDYGARHLKGQVEAAPNWQHLLAIFESTQGFDIERVVRASNAVFMAAEHAMSRVNLQDAAVA
jgi:heme oxygenase